MLGNVGIGLEAAREVWVINFDMPATYTVLLIRLPVQVSLPRYWVEVHV